MKKLFRKTISTALGAAMSLSVLSSFAAYAEITPNPVISRGVPAYSGQNQFAASYANDEHYFSFWSSATPDYIAYDLSGVPEADRKQVIAVWYNTSAYDNIGSYVNRNMEPSDYTVEVNAAEGGEYPADGWEVVETVTGNTLSSRQHLVNMQGYNWIRLNISQADDQEGKQASVNFDVHNVSDGISDSWLFLGDSITAGGMNNCYGTGFATHVNQLDERYFPIQENGGIGGITSTDGKNNIDRWLSTSHARYVSLAYGTNDAWGSSDRAELFYNNTKYMIDAIIAAGKIPVLPKIPSSTNPDVGDHVPAYNAMIDKLYEEYSDKLVHGPDFDEFFKEHPDYLSGDGVHPADTGYAEMRKVWAETMYSTVYTAEGTTPPDDKTLYGDANLDEKITVADAVAILQSIGNKDKYELKPQGKINADVDGVEGISAMDSLVIMQVDAGIYKAEELPLKS